MSSSCRWVALLALASTVGGCRSTPPLTELVVVIHADVPVPTLHVTATGPEGSLAVDARITSPTLPVSIVLTRDHAPYGPVTIHVEGGGAISDTQTDLVPGERLRLDVQLSASCLCTSCMPPQTCRAGTCMDRSVAASSLPRWIEGTDAAVAPGLDGALVSEAGMLPDAGPTRPTCGCMGQPCCAGACNGMLSCRSSTCMDCFTTDPTIMGTTPTTAMFLTAISAINDTLWISSSDGMSVGQVPFVLTGGATGTGTAVVTQIVGITTTGSAMHVHGPGGSMGTINLAGATLMGSFTAPMHGAVEGAITHASATGHVLTLTAWNGTMGTITFVPVETCR